MALFLSSIYVIDRLKTYLQSKNIPLKQCQYNYSNCLTRVSLLRAVNDTRSRVPKMQAAFPRRTATDRRWRRHVVEQGSLLTSAICRPTFFATISACSPHIRQTSRLRWEQSWHQRWCLHTWHSCRVLPRKLQTQPVYCWPWNYVHSCRKIYKEYFVTSDANCPMLSRCTS